MAISRTERKIKVEGRVRWTDLMDTIEAAVSWVEPTPELARDAERLRAIAEFLARRAKRAASKVEGWPMAPKDETVVQFVPASALDAVLAERDRLADLIERVAEELARMDDVDSEDAGFWSHLFRVRTILAEAEPADLV